jgi:hypothetical protein
MEVITISSEAFQAIMDKIDHINDRLDNFTASKVPALNEEWLDIQQACFTLRISKRTLQSYRDEGILPFSQINGKIYFKASDIQKHLEKHYRKLKR